MSSKSLPMGIAAGDLSVHQIMVDTLPLPGYLALVAGASIMTLATSPSWPVTTRRIGG